MLGAGMTVGVNALRGAFFAFLKKYKHKDKKP
jgi:hypothetical protein